MATANEIITGALRLINAYAPGQTLDPDDQADALATLNDLVESWSIEHLMIFNAVEQVLMWTAGQYSYTIGAPTLGTPGATFTATVNSGTASFTVPNLATWINTNNLAIGATLMDAAGYIPSGTKVTGLNTASNLVTMSANATGTMAGDQITFTGQFYVPLPARITNVFTRINSGNSALDYPCEVITQEAYTDIGIKNLPGPWPTVLYYNRVAPVGELLIWKVPQNGGEAHIWCDYIFPKFQTVADSFIVPEGYSRALKANLALELAPRYGRPVTPDLMRIAQDSKAQIKALNAMPTPEATFDSAIVGRRQQDAGWYLHGGFR